MSRPVADPFGFAAAINIDHLNDDQLDAVADILNKIPEA